VTPTGSLISTWARADAGIKFGEIPPATTPMFTVTRWSVFDSPAPESSSETRDAVAIAVVMARGASTGSSSKAFNSSRAVRSRSIAFTPL
jgi:hypothetical protein